jgi:hypothetical protein
MKSQNPYPTYQPAQDDRSSPVPVAGISEPLLTQEISHHTMLNSAQKKPESEASQVDLHGDSKVIKKSLKHSKKVEDKGDYLIVH